MSILKLIPTVLTTRASQIFITGIANQIVLSAASFAAGLILIRLTDNTQYGYYVLITSTVPLLAQLQQAFLAPELNRNITHSDTRDRSDLVTSLYKGQRVLLVTILIATLLLVGVLNLDQRLGKSDSLVLLSGTVAATAWLYRDFFRMLQNAYRQPAAVLQSDLLFVTIMVTGVFTAARLVNAAALSALAISAACLASGFLLYRRYTQTTGWSDASSLGLWAKTMKKGVWSALGCAVHWCFSQGYAYLVAAMLSVSALASISATRLTLMPLGLIGVGISSQMLPMSTLWLKNHGARGLAVRLLLFSSALAALGLIYISGLWLCRDWLFQTILKKDFPNRDYLLIAWSATFLVTMIRDQILYIHVAQHRFRILFVLTLVSAIVGLSVCYFAVERHGEIGGPIGLLSGELTYIFGIAMMTMHDFSKERSGKPSAVPSYQP